MILELVDLIGLVRCVPILKTFQFYCFHMHKYSEMHFFANSKPNNTVINNGVILKIT